VDAAIAEGHIDDEITQASTADWASAYRDGGGGIILVTTGGIVHDSAVILDLADGSRRLVNVYCSGPTATEDGTLVSPRSCGAVGLLPEEKRVGHERWLNGP
jgi:hypothetical protein